MASDPDGLTPLEPFPLRAMSEDEGDDDDDDRHGDDLGRNGDVDADDEVVALTASQGKGKFAQKAPSDDHAAEEDTAVVSLSASKGSSGGQAPSRSSTGRDGNNGNGNSAFVSFSANSSKGGSSSRGSNRRSSPAEQDGDDDGDDDVAGGNGENMVQSLVVKEEVPQPFAKSTPTATADFWRRVTRLFNRIDSRQAQDGKISREEFIEHFKVGPAVCQLRVLCQPAASRPELR
jgi:hypothetical protein